MKVLLRVFGILLVLALGCGAVFYLHPLWVADQRVRLHLWRAGVRSDYVELPAGRIHYFEAQAAPGSANIPLVLVHGLGARGEDWAPMIPGMAAKGFHVYVPDLLGYGRSARPDTSYSISLEESVVVQFLDAMHLARTDVAGWSMGGWIAMKLALDHPERVDRLVVYDSAGIYFPPFDPELFTPGDEAGLDRLMAMLVPHPVKLPGFVARDALRKLQRNKWIVGRSMASMMSGRDLLDFRISGLRPPMLIVWGAEDRLIPETVGETMHRLVAQSVLRTVPGCGHMAPAECFGPVIADTVEFLTANPAR